MCAFGSSRDNGLAVARAYGTKVPAHNASRQHTATSTTLPLRARKMCHIQIQLYSVGIGGRIFVCHSPSYIMPSGLPYSFLQMAITFYPNINSTVGAKFCHSYADVWMACGFDRHAHMAKGHMSMRTSLSPTTSATAEEKKYKDRVPTK